MRIRVATAVSLICCGLVFVSPTARAEQQPNQAPRILGTAQSEQEFDAYSAVIRSREPVPVAHAAEQFVQRYPDSGLAAYVHQSAMQAYYQLSDMAQVIRHGEAALRDLSGNAVVLGLISTAYLNQRQPEKAVDRARASIAAIAKMELPERADRTAWRAQLNALDSAVHLTLGSALLEISLRDSVVAEAKLRLAEARTSLEQALAKNPTSEDASYRLATAFDAQNDSEGALRYYAWTVALGGVQAASAEAKVKELCRARSLLDKDAITNAHAEIAKGVADLRVSDSKP